jgi:hypothetical protein
MDPANPNYKSMAGNYIYEDVEKFVGEELAGKITGMLIDLPIEEIKAFLYDFDRLRYKAAEANNVLQQIHAFQ